MVEWIECQPLPLRRDEILDRRKRRPRGDCKDELGGIVVQHPIETAHVDLYPASGGIADISLASASADIELQTVARRVSDDIDKLGNRPRPDGSSAPHQNLGSSGKGS